MKQKIAVVVDNLTNGWCWTTTARNTIHQLPQYEFEVMSNEEFKVALGTGNDFSDFDLVWFRGYSSVAMNEQSVNKLKCKFISTVGTGGKKLDLRLDGAERTAKRGMALVVQNQMALHQAYRRGYERVYMIPNGVDVRLFHPGEPLKHTKKVVGVAANTHGSRNNLKGIPFIKKACDIAQCTYKEVNSELPLSHESIADWYRTLDYYIQPSDSEGCSNSVMEAMASGLPVMICENVGYHGEICKSAIDHADGQVIFVRRNENDISEKIKILETNPIIKERCIKNALQFAKLHDWKYIAKQYSMMFDEILGLKAKPPREVQQGFTVGQTMAVEALENFRTGEKTYIKGRRYIMRKAQYDPVKEKVKLI